MRTHCKRGHRYDEANTYIDRRGVRNCRACARRYRRKWQEANPVDPEERRERDRVWREKNRERIRARNRADGGHATKHHLEERNRIIAIIKGRRDLHVSFVDHALNAGVQPSDSIYTAIAELDAILREIEQ